MVRWWRRAHFFYLRMEIDIERIVAQVIAGKEGKGKAPAHCDLHEILKAIAPGITTEMRRLVREGKYDGSITINKVPVVRKKITHKALPCDT